MLEAASLVALFLAFALLHGAAPKRFPWQRVNPTRTVLTCMKLGAPMACAAGIVLWAQAANTVEALLVTATALTTVATAFVPLVAKFPKTMWGLALASPLVIAALAIFGASRG